MKMKKIVSVTLACLMLFSVLAVNAFAVEYTGAEVKSVKTFYTDGETLDVSTLYINDDTGFIDSYAANPSRFSFSIPFDKALTVEDTIVDVYYDGALFDSYGISVFHASSTEWVSVSDTQHGHVCAGCGEMVDLTDHTLSPWVTNNDAAFFTPETETATCSDCGATITREIAGTEQYLSVFAEYPTLLTVMGYIALIVKTIVINSKY